MSNTPTAAWPRTIWSEAGQINRLNARPARGDESAAPVDYFRHLREAGEDHEAALFLAQALPRYDAVAWAADSAARSPGPHPASMQAVRAWLANPGEDNRRAAGLQAGQSARADAASLCAWAVFHAGGSLAPAGQPPAPPPRGATGRFAGAAVLAAAILAPNPTDTLRRALDEGARIAARLETTP